MIKKKRENWVYFTGTIKYGKTTWSKGFKVKPSTVKHCPDIIEKPLKSMARGSFQVFMSEIIKHPEWVK